MNRSKLKLYHRGNHLHQHQYKLSDFGKSMDYCRRNQYCLQRHIQQVHQRRNRRHRYLRKVVAYRHNLRLKWLVNNLLEQLIRNKLRQFHCGNHRHLHQHKVFEFGKLMSYYHHSRYCCSRHKKQVLQIRIRRHHCRRIRIVNRHNLRLKLLANILLE